MSEKFKPCPFCGGTNIIIGLASDTGYSWCVTCSDCWSRTGPMSREKAITAWNSRHGSGEIPEWLKKAIEERIKLWKENIEGFLKLESIRPSIAIDELLWVLSLKPPEQ